MGIVVGVRVGEPERGSHRMNHHCNVVVYSERRLKAGGSV